MSATEEELNHLQEEIAKGTEETKSYLAQVHDKLAEFDSQHKVSETATGFMQAGLDKAHGAVDELKELGTKISTKSKTKSAEIVENAHDSLYKMHAALLALKDHAVEYDQRVKGKVSSSVTTIFTSTKSTATRGIETITAALTSVQNAIAARAMAAAKMAFATTGKAIKAAETVDAHIGASTKVQGVVDAVTGKVIDLDKKLGVSETALKVDAKVSGGKGADLVQKGVGLVQNSVEFVRDTVTQAKAAADEADKPAEAAAAPSETAPAATETPKNK